MAGVSSPYKQSFSTQSPRASQVGAFLGDKIGRLESDPSEVGVHGTAWQCTLSQEGCETKVSYLDGPGKFSKPKVEGDCCSQSQGQKVRVRR